jgi:sialic acid synthase SpsE
MLDGAKNTFSVAGVEYSPARVLLVAELGTAHGGNIDTAVALIDAAARAGADCVKTQIVYADEILHPASGLVPLPGGNVPLYETFRRLETPPAFFRDMKQYAEERGLLFLATPFGRRSAAELRELRPAFVKVASPELNYVQLLREIAAWGTPVALSSGVSTLGDIEAALAYFDRRNVCLLHCVTAYPAPAEDYNTRVIGNLAAVFGVAVGVSDHSIDPVLVPLAAMACGACLVEKHFCLSHSAGGLDDPIALEPADFARLARAVREAEALSGDAIIERLKGLYGVERVLAVLGDGVKRLSSAERGNYERTNRSLHALTAIAKGEAFSAGNLGVLRTEKVLRPGIAPLYYDAVLGRVARADINAGEGIRWEDIE